MSSVLVVGLAVVGGLGALVVTLAVVGSLLPRDHVATRRLRLRREPGEVWGVITDFGGQLTWRPRVKGVSKVSETAREKGLVGEVWREQAGGHALDLATREATPPDALAATPGRLVREIVTPGLPFSGRWEFEVVPVPEGGTALRLTEHGAVANPIFRVISRMMGQAGQIEGYLGDLARLFNEPVRFD